MAIRGGVRVRRQCCWKDTLLFPRLLYVESLGRAYNQRGSTFSAEQRSLVAQKMEELPDLVREMPLDTTAAMTVGGEAAAEDRGTTASASTAAAIAQQGASAVDGRDMLKPLVLESIPGSRCHLGQRRAGDRCTHPLLSTAVLAAATKG